MTYAQFQADSAPPAMQAERWRVFLSTLGDSKDAAATAAKDAARCALVGSCPDDALTYHAAERALEQYPGESFDAWRARLVAVWDAFEFLGTEIGLRGALTGAGYAPSISTAIGAAPSWWGGAWPPASEGPRPPAWVGTWPAVAGTVAHWPSRFWVTLASTAYAPWSWDDGPNWGDDITWGSTATVAQVTLVKRIIKRWRPPHCVCIGVYAQLTDTTRIFWPTWPHED